ncbi:hypothetical protein BS78_06G091500 [Paspalum vaginatum]|nr:hypothetical protein BS78_06G091500 [Paspalum vaginatum]
MRLLVLTVLLSSLHALSSSGGTDTLSSGHALAGDARLVSSNGKFALGFFQTTAGGKSSNSTLSLYLGIWFNKVPKLTPVWTANVDNPVTGGTSPPELVVSGDGNLIISAHGTIIWRTQANITVDGDGDDTVAVLSDNGNLVLRSSSNASDVFWQSFDHPTDTLLSGAKIGRNKVSGFIRRIVSRKSSADQAPGVYSAELSLLGAIELLWRSSAVYWSSGTWNGRFFGSIPEMSGQSGPTLCNYTFVNNTQEVYFSYTLLDESMIFHNFLDVSGQMHTRIWSDLAQDWITAGTQPKDPCGVYATCGPFTVCNGDGDTFCNCMKGFSETSPENWELEDRTGGCIRNTPLNCGDADRNQTGMADKFYSMTNIRLPQNTEGSQNNASSADECAQVCLSNCSCSAYSYAVGGCSIWHGELLNVVAEDNGQTLYLRLAAKEVQGWKSKRRSGMVIGGVAIGAGIALTGFILAVVILRRIGKCRSSHTVDKNDRGGIGIIAFRYIDLERATKNFSEKLGGGSFGSVFKGCLLSNSTAIAVKRLDCAHQGEKQFRAEVNSIGIIQHVNLVKLVGFCCERGRRVLVYEHMPNGSLDHHIFQSHGMVLSWAIRYQIALGVARGLAYLHHGCRDCIIHCDIKPENILLDTSFVPKIADFGMAKFLGRDFSRVVTTMRGTVGYLAPEWISGTAITPKVDVYSYGMVLLEIISGRRNSRVDESSRDDDDDDDHGCYFPVQVAHELLSGSIASLVDENLLGDVNLEEVDRVCKVACWCIQDNESDRPTMGEVVRFLDGTSEPDMPPMPRLLNAMAGGSNLA